MNIDDMCERWSHVEEVEKVVGEWRFFIERCPVILKIKVVKTTAVPGMYTGLANYKIQSPRQGGPYRSVYFKDTPKEALEDALLPTRDDGTASILCSWAAILSGRGMKPPV